MENVKELAGTIESAGYESISDFCRRSKVEASFETVRRAVPGGQVSTWSLYLIMLALGKTRTQIRDLLLRYGGGLLAPMLSEGDTVPAEIAPLCQAMQTIWNAAKGDNCSREMVLNTVKVLARGVGCDVSGQVAEMEA